MDSEIIIKQIGEVFVMSVNGSHSPQAPDFAPLKRRLTAFSHDALWLSTYALVLLTVSLFLYPDRTGDKSLFNLVFVFCLFIPVILYFSVFEHSEKHASPGKQKAGLMVVCEKQPLTFTCLLRRNTLKYLPWMLSVFSILQVITGSGPDGVLYTLLIMSYFLIVMYFISPYFDEDSRTIYDRLSGTTVVGSEKWQK